MKRAKILIIACLLAAGSTVRVRGDEGVPQGPEFLVPVFTGAAQFAPSVAADAAGNFVVVWGGPYIDGSYFGIAGRRFDLMGNPLGGDFQVNTFSTGGQGSPQVAANNAGDFVVVWESGDQDGSYVGLFGQAFDDTGAPSGVEFQVNVFTTSRQFRASVAMGSAGDFVVVWDSYTQDGEYEGIFGRHFDSTGNPLSGEFQVNDLTSGRQYSPTVTAAGAGRFVVVWSSIHQVSQGAYLYGTYAKVISPGGNDLTGEFRVGSLSAQTTSRPVVAADPMAGFVVAWAGGSDGSGPAILSRQFDNSGLPIGPERQVNVFTTGNQLNPSIGVDDAGNFVLIWENGGQDGSDSGVFGRSLDSSGIPIGGEFQVNTYTYKNQSDAKVSMDADGDFIVAWRDETLDGSYSGIFGRLFFGPITCSLGETDGDGICENFDNCPGVYNPGQENTDGDGVGDDCDMTLTSPLDQDVLDCSDPAALQPAFTWSTAAFDLFKVSMGTSPGFEKGTFVSSGDRFIRTGSYTPPAKKWMKACKKALEAGPGTPVMFIRVFGKDRDVPKQDPGRTTFTNTVQVDITD